MSIGLLLPDLPKNNNLSCDLVRQSKQSMDPLELSRPQVFADLPSRTTTSGLHKDFEACYLKDLCLIQERTCLPKGHSFGLLLCQVIIHSNKIKLPTGRSMPVFGKVESLLLLNRQEPSLLESRDSRFGSINQS